MQRIQLSSFVGEPIKVHFYPKPEEGEALGIPVVDQGHSVTFNLLGFETLGIWVKKEGEESAFLLPWKLIAGIEVSHTEKENTPRKVGLRPG